MNNSKIKTHNLYKVIFLFVVFLGIGYAFLEANLNINGDVTVEAPEFNTYVQSTSVTSGSTSGTPVIVGNDKKEVDFSTARTDNGSSFFEETTTLVNKGSKKSYLISIDIKVYDSNNTEVTLSAPYEYTLTHGDGTSVVIGEELLPTATATYKLKFNYISGTDMTTVINYPTYTFKINYIFATTVPIIIPTGKTKDNLTTGDEITIGSEKFNFIKYEGTNDEDIVILAKYNLKIGSIYTWECDNSTNHCTDIKTYEYTSNDSGYGKQSSETRGWVGEELPANGVVTFSTKNYWYDGSRLKTEYGSNWHTNNIYDPINYKDAPGEINNNGRPTNQNYSVAYYVENYKTILEGYGATIKDARLLTYAEATDTSIGCDGNNGTCPTTGSSAFVTNTSFWFGSVGDDYYVWSVYSDGGFTDSSHLIPWYFGVRPVIVISKSDI